MVPRISAQHKLHFVCREFFSDGSTARTGRVLLLRTFLEAVFDNVRVNTKGVGKK